MKILGLISGDPTQEKNATDVYEMNIVFWLFGINSARKEIYKQYKS